MKLGMGLGLSAAGVVDFVPPVLSAPVNSVAPSISGTPAVGALLTASVGAWSGYPAPAYAIVWRRNGVAIPGATANAYTLVEADYGADLSVEVTATNTEGSASATSSGVVIAGVAPVNTVAPSVSGSTGLGDTLTTENGTWTAYPAISGYTYQWQRNGVDIGGATASTHDIVAGDSGADMSCVVTATNAEDSTSAASGNSITAQTFTAPLISGAPTVSGIGEVGELLTATPASATGNPAPTRTWQWMRDGVDISGATSSTYTLVPADGGTDVSVRQIETNSLGFDAETSAVVAVPESDIYPIFFEAQAVGNLEDANVAAVRFVQATPITETTGIVLFTQKNVNYSYGSENAQRVCARDYTIDFESESISMSSTRVIEQPAQWDIGLGYASEPCAHKLSYGPNAGRIILITRTNDNVDQRLTSSTGVIYNFYSRFSDDNGSTWSAKTLCVPNDGANYASASAMLELPSGRLIYPMYRADPRELGALYSDDHGATWARSAMAAGADRSYTEPAIFRKENGTLVLLVRSDTNDANLERGQFESYDDGVTWSYIGLNAQAAFKNSNTALLSDGGMLMAGSTANPAFYERIKYRMLVSIDEAATFPESWAPFDDLQGTGYSQLARLKDETYMLSYETFSPESASTPAGQINSRNNAMLLVFNSAAINAPADVIPVVPQTATQIFDAYKDRVLADGGTIYNEASCLAAIGAAISGGYWLDSGIALSPNWGVKVDGSNWVTKLYDLIGTNDTLPVAGSLFDTTSFGHASVNFATTARYAITPAILMDEGGAYALAVSGAAPSTSTVVLASFEGTTLTDLPVAIRTRTQGSTTASAVSAGCTNGTALGTYNVAAPAAGSSVCAYVENGANRFSRIVNGATDQVQILGYSAIRNVTRRIGINRSLTTSGTTGSAGVSWVNEVWHLRHATRTTAKQLSTDQGARYA